MRNYIGYWLQSRVKFVQDRVKTTFCRILKSIAWFTIIFILSNHISFSSSNKQENRSLEIENLQIKHCLQTIEEKLQWGPCEQWTNYDFEKLSERIFDETKVSLSVTTLKRVWGRIKYPHDPSLTTLNVLALFIGFPDWRAFLQTG